MVFWNVIWKKKNWAKCSLRVSYQFQNRRLSVEVFSAISQLIIHINTLQLVTTTSSRDLCPRRGINMTTTQNTLPQASQNWINTMSNEQMGFKKLTSKMTLEHDICTSKAIGIWLHRRMKFSSKRNLILWCAAMSSKGRRGQAPVMATNWSCLSLKVPNH